MTSDIDGIARRGRILGTTDFEVGMGSLNHRAVIRDSHQVDRVELSQEMILGVIMDILRGLNEERFVSCGPHRVLQLPHVPLLLTHLECELKSFFLL